MTILVVQFLFSPFGQFFTEHLLSYKCKKTYKLKHCGRSQIWNCKNHFELSAFSYCQVSRCYNLL